MQPNDLDFLSASLLEKVAALGCHLDQNAAAIRRISGTADEVRALHVADQAGHRRPSHALECGQLPDIRATVEDQAGQHGKTSRTEIQLDVDLSQAPAKVLNEHIQALGLLANLACFHAAHDNIVSTANQYRR